MYPCVPAGHGGCLDARIPSGPCVYLCARVKTHKEGNKSWTHRGTTPGLSWCEEAGSTLGCSAKVDRFSQASGAGINRSWLDKGGWASGEDIR